jgi:alanine dehydrogenase
MKGNQSTEVRKTLLLGQNDVKELLNMGETLEAVENGFKLKARGQAIMPCKIYLELPEYNGDYRAMPAYIDGSAGMKWVSVYPNNHNYNLPAVIAMIILCDPNNSYPLAIMDGTYITSMRTGAAGGIAVKYLAKKDSSVIGMVGVGEQAETQLLAINEVLPKIEEVKAFSRHEDSRQRFAHKMGERLNINIHPVDTIEAAADADIIVATTYATGPVVKKEHVRPGTHINAIGADAEGKQELDTNLLVGAKIIIDEMEQACHSGEINVPLAHGKIKVEDIYGTLGEVAAGMIKGRENNEEITIFDSTGLAIQDMVCAKLVYLKAKEKGASTFNFF